jgi:hypothetical protein
MFETSFEVWRDVAPKILGSAGLLIAGWILAELSKNISERILKRLRIDDVSEKIGFDAFLIESGIRLTATGLLALGLYWAILIAFILAAIDALGMDLAGDLFIRFSLYLPKVIVALVILVLGVFVARLARSASFSYMNKIKAHGARLFSMAAYVAILIFTFSLALETLGIGGIILVAAFQILFGSICLAAAIAFGLGGRHWAKSVIDKVTQK